MRLRLSVLALVLALISGALARAQDWSGQRDISGLTIDYAVSGANGGDASDRSVEPDHGSATDETDKGLARRDRSLLGD